MRSRSARPRSTVVGSTKAGGAGASLQACGNVTSNRVLRMSKWVDRFFAGACVLLCYTAALKAFPMLKDPRLLSTLDPLLHLRESTVMGIVAGVEAVIAAYLVFRSNVVGRALALLWLSAQFLLYRFALQALAPGTPCPCFGSLAIWLPFSPRVLHILTGLFVVYLMGGSCAILGAALRRRSVQRALSRATDRRHTE
jgi:hypothetical protein